MKCAVVLMAFLVLAVPSASACEELSQNDIVQAFLGAPEIANAQQLFGEEVERDFPRILYKESLCGAVGCQYSVLVAQEFRTASVNPWTKQILGLVRVSASGEIVDVRLVRLVPVHAEEE